jgi:hypothetical protein
MTNPDTHEIEARLRDGESPSAPADLAERLKEGIPERPRVVEFPRESERKIRLKPSFLLAATIAIAFIGGSLAYRVSLEAPMKSPAAPEAAPASEWAEQGIPEASAGRQELQAAEDSEAVSSERPGAEERRMAKRVIVKEDGVPSRQRKILADRSGRDPMVQPSETDAIQSAPAKPSGKISEEKRLGDESAARGQELELPERIAPSSPPAMQSHISASRRAERADQPASMVATDVIRAPGAAPSTGGTTEPNDQPYGDMFFKSHGVNPFIDTEDDTAIWSAAICLPRRRSGSRRW